MRGKSVTAKAVTVTNNIRINNLAVKAQENCNYFADLWQEVEHTFNTIIHSYFLKNNLLTFNFDNDDYYSAVSQSVWESLQDFDNTKGNFMPRFAIFARNRMKIVTDFNLSAKRHDKEQSAISYDLLFDSGEQDSPVDSSGTSDTERLINGFIAQDREGHVIEILASAPNAVEKHKQLVEFFGQYTSTERKRVQRVRQRLQLHLTTNGVHI